MQETGNMQETNSTQVTDNTQDVYNTQDTRNMQDINNTQDTDGTRDTRGIQDAIKRETTDRFPCPGCGAVMTFNPETGGLHCAYCSKSLEIKGQEGEIEEYDLASAEKHAIRDWGSEKRIIRCESCGAETVLDAHLTAQFCAFCGSSHIVRSENTRAILPESLIPFSISLEKARQLFRKWLKKQFFAPSALKELVLKENQQAGNITGVYVPCWTYDSDTHSMYAAEKGTYYYVTRTDWVIRNGRRVPVTRTERKTRWEPVCGIYSYYYNDILVNGSRNIDAGLMAKLEPFHMEKLVRYRPEYISGFLAERYSINLHEGWQIAKDIIKSRIRAGIIRKINGDEVRNLQIHTTFNTIKYKHLLLPVWMSSYTFKNKVYRYMINGQTGEVQGTAPVSFWKAAASALAILAAAALVYLAVFAR